MHFKEKFFDLIESIDVSNMKLWSNEQIFGFLENNRMDYRLKSHNWTQYFWYETLFETFFWSRKNENDFKLKYMW